LEFLLILAQKEDYFPIFALKLKHNEKIFPVFRFAVMYANVAFGARHASCAYFLSCQQGVIQHGTGR
jgi:hypothetical protein